MHRLLNVSLPFESRIDQAFWRGSLGYEAVANLPRAQLGLISLNHSRLFNVSYLTYSANASFWKPPLPSPELLKIDSVARMHGIPQEEFGRFKILINMPGSATGSYSRNLQTILPLGSVVLNWRSEFEEFYYDWLVEGETHLTVDESNIVSTVSSLLDHEHELARRLADSARRFAREKLSAHRLGEYFSQVLVFFFVMCVLKIFSI